MKNSVNRKLLAGAILSLAAYLALLWLSGTGILYPLPHWAQALQAYLLLGFHAVPFFCLQLLLCRAVRRRWLAALPSVLVMGAAVVCAVRFMTALGWDSLGWAVLLLGCIAPAAGCAAGWVVYALSRRAARRQSAPAEGARPAEKHVGEP